jgi:hypothetical protein
MANELYEIIIKIHEENNSRPSECDGCDDYSTLSLPITEIDEVICQAYFKIYRSGLIHFVVESKNVYEDSNDMSEIRLYFEYLSTRDFKNNKLLEWCVSLLDKLSILKLNIDGRFSSVDNTLISLKLVDIFSNIPNVKIHKLETCCVCYKHTHTKTHCGHHLCYRCWFRIPEDTDEDRDIGIPCPMCRQEIKYLDL